MTSASKISEPAAGSAEWAHALTPALVLGFVAIIFLLIATLIVGDLNLRNVYAAGEAVEHSEAVKVTLQQVLMTTVDAETGERGFIITGENSYLEPYDRAQSAIADDIARVQALVGDDKDQQLDLAVELHGGTVTVRSAGLLQGSTFVVSLPASTLPEAAIAETPLTSA